MRTLSPTLEAEQKKESLSSLVKIVLSLGTTEHIFGIERIKSLNHVEEPRNVNAEVVLDNSDGFLTHLNLKGFKGVISYGAVTSVGEEYSASSPMWVIAQRFDSVPGRLICTLELIGIFNLLSQDKASKNYIPDKNDTKTVKQLIREIAGDSGVTQLDCFSHCRKYDCIFDSEDNLINTYMPKDGLRIFLNQPRLDIVKKLLECTKCVIRAGEDGKLHIFVPAISGTIYDYQYSLEEGHTFFASANRKSLVIPNYVQASSPTPTVPNWVIVNSTPYVGEAKDQEDIDKFGVRKHTTDFGAGNLLSDQECAEYAQQELDRYRNLHDSYYEGIAIDHDSVGAIGEIRVYQQYSFESAAQAQQVAEAILSKYKLNAEMGAANVPLNVAQEIYDYIRVVDARQQDERAGNIGRITRNYNAEKSEWRMNFGFGQRPEPTVDIMPIAEESSKYFGQLIVDRLYAQKIVADQLDMYWLDPDNNIDLSKIGSNLDDLPDGELYSRVKSTHLIAGQLKLDETVFYRPGYNPVEKEKGIAKSSTAPTSPETDDFWLDTSVVPNTLKRWDGSTWIKADPTNLDDIPNGAYFARTKSSSLTPDGLVILDAVHIDHTNGTYDLVNRNDISAGHIKLSSVVQTTDYRTTSDTEKTTWNNKPDNMDEIGEGATYQRVKATELSSGVIKLYSGTVKSGEWYNLSGVAIDATKGIQIYGTNMAFKTAAYKDGPAQCYVGSDGKMYAGGGSVSLDANGININGQTLKFVAGSYNCWIALDAFGGLLFGAGLSNPTAYTFNRKVKPSEQGIELGDYSYPWSTIYGLFYQVRNSNAAAAVIMPYSHKYGDIGYSNSAFRNMYADNFYNMTPKMSKLGTLATLDKIKEKKDGSGEIAGGRNFPGQEHMDGDDGIGTSEFMEQTIGWCKELKKRIEVLESDLAQLQKVIK